MTIFQPLADRSPQKPPGRASRNKVLANSADDPDAANKLDDFGGCDNSDDSNDFLMTSSASWPSCKT